MVLQNALAVGFRVQPLPRLVAGPGEQLRVPQQLDMDRIGAEAEALDARQQPGGFGLQGIVRGQRLGLGRRDPCHQRTRHRQIAQPQPRQAGPAIALGDFALEVHIGRDRDAQRAADLEGERALPQFNFRRPIRAEAGERQQMAAEQVQLFLVPAQRMRRRHAGVRRHAVEQQRLDPHSLRPAQLRARFNQRRELQAQQNRRGQRAQTKQPEPDPRQSRLPFRRAKDIPPTHHRELKQKHSACVNSALASWLRPVAVWLGGVQRTP